MKLQGDITFGLLFATVFFCGAGESESESSSDSDSESEELSADELLVLPTGPFPFSSESLKHREIKIPSKKFHQNRICYINTFPFSLSGKQPKRIFKASELSVEPIKTINLLFVC